MLKVAVYLTLLGLLIPASELRAQRTIMAERAARRGEAAVAQPGFAGVRTEGAPWLVDGTAGRARIWPAARHGVVRSAKVVTPPAVTKDVPRIWPHVGIRRAARAERRASGIAPRPSLWSL
jgi:hypothetical protein